MNELRTWEEWETAHASGVSILQVSNKRPLVPVTREMAYAAFQRLTEDDHVGVTEIDGVIFIAIRPLKIDGLRDLFHAAWDHVDVDSRSFPGRETK